MNIPLITAAPPADLPVTPSAGKPTDGTWRRTRQTWQFRVGGTILLVLLFIALAGPWFAPHGPTEFVGPAFSTDAGGFFGTDFLGRDVLSRFLNGGRTVTAMAVCATVLGVGAGTIIALVCSYSSPRVDSIVMRTSDIVLSFPSIVLALLMLSITGPSAVVVVLAVALSYAPRSARVLRAAGKGVADMDFVHASELAGAGRWKIRLQEILPNITGPLMVEFGLRLTYSVALVASLSFLGLGLQPPASDWGLMINENRVGLTAAPWAVYLPIIGIALLSVSANLATDGIARSIGGARGSGD